MIQNQYSGGSVWQRSTVCYGYMDSVSYVSL